MTIEKFLSSIRGKRAKELAQFDITVANDDCKQGYYNKAYRYMRKDKGSAYDIGWTIANIRFHSGFPPFVGVSTSLYYPFTLFLLIVFYC